MERVRRGFRTEERRASGSALCQAFSSAVWVGYSPLEGRKAFLRNQKPSMRPPGSPLLNAVLGTLSDDGPCPTAFSASPAAEFECDGLRRLASEGWWVCYACKLEIFSSAPDDPDEIVELTFTPPDKKVHNGKPFSWMLSMAVDDSGVRRLTRAR